MAMLPSTHTEVAVEVIRIAASAGPMDERAEALVECLHRAIRFDAAWIGLLNPEHRRHLPLLDVGHEERVRGLRAGPQVLDEVQGVGLHGKRAPIRLSGA